MRKLQLVIILVVIFGVHISCGTEPNNDHTINPNIHLLKNCCGTGEKYGGNYYLGQLYNNELIATVGLTRFELDANFEIISRKNIWQNLIGGGGGYFFLSETGETLLFSRSTKLTATDVTLSRGSLHEYNLHTNIVKTLRDSTYHISTALYWHGNTNKLVYYSYGNNEDLVAGYYLFDKISNTDSLLLEHSSEIGPFGPYDILNGFDLSSDNQKIIIPDIRASYINGPRSPQIIEYNLNSQQADTFATKFDLSFLRIGLWLRYSPSGDRILYCTYPMNPISASANDDSEVGIIELPTRKKRVLDVNINPEGDRKSVQLAPTWSNDGKHIVYGSAALINPEGRVGEYSLYLLKNVDDPQNFLN